MSKSKIVISAVALISVFSIYDAEAIGQSVPPSTLKTSQQQQQPTIDQQLITILNANNDIAEQVAIQGPDLLKMARDIKTKIIAFIKEQGEIQSGLHNQINQLTEKDRLSQDYWRKYIAGLQTVRDKPGLKHR